MWCYIKGRNRGDGWRKKSVGKRLKVRARVECRRNENKGGGEFTKTGEHSQRRSNLQFFFFFFFMQRVDMKENLEERQKCCIHFPPLSRVSTGTLNIQLRPFRRYIAITLIIIYLYFGSA